jgi:hypothetical protein
MTSKQLPLVVAAATTIAAAGVSLVMPAVSQAAPCAAYQFPGGTVEINYQAVNAQTTFTTINASTKVDTTNVTHYPDGGDTSGTLTGYINGNSIHLEVGRGSKYKPNILDGLIGPDNRAHGTMPYGDTTQNWDSNTTFTCVDNPEPEKVGPSPNQTGGAGTADTGPKPLVGDQQTPKGLGNATVIADTDMYDKPDGQGKVIGTLRVGEVHPLMEPCRDDWCRVGQIELGGFDGLPNGTAWVYSKGFLTFS